MELKSKGESFALRPVRTASPLRKEHGVWVFRSDRKIAAAATDKVLRDLRDRRDTDNRGIRP